MSDACVFCDRIERGDYDETAFANVVRFAPLNPVTEGHMLFVPREHVMYSDTQPELTGDVFAAAAEYAGGWIEQGFNLIQSTGHAATQTIMHLHVHYVPRHHGDGLHLPWTGQRPAAEPTPGQP